jgi:release factor glutamine methyltransferase
VICANLPYVATGDLAGLARDLAFEPRVALDGGQDGLDVVRRLLDLLPGTLAADGVALLEIGADQGEGIVRETAARLPGWRCAVMTDLAGLPRLAVIEPPMPGEPPMPAEPPAGIEPPMSGDGPAARA